MKRYFGESGLSRLEQHMREHDSAIITAYRSEFTKPENQQRNQKLLYELRSKGYGVTSVKGSWIENLGTEHQREVGEHSFFVVNTRDNPEFFDHIKELGENFGSEDENNVSQDAVLLIPKSGQEAILYGTSKTSQWPGYHKSQTFPLRSLGSVSQFFTKKGNKPFYFGESVELLEFHPLRYPSEIRGPTEMAKCNYKDLDPVDLKEIEDIMQRKKDLMPKVFMKAED